MRGRIASALLVGLRSVCLCGLLLLVPLRAFALDSGQLMVAANKLGPNAVKQAQLLLKFIDRMSHLDEATRIVAANDYMNAHIEFHTDWEVWGVEDYWAAPLEALDKGRGDCEDYAIAKYFPLLAAGVPEEKLRMVYVRVMLDGKSQAHMVLAYYPQPDAVPLILDNIDPILKPASQRPDLTPVFSFSTVGLWKGVGAVTAGNPVARLSMWRDLLSKVRDEGF